MQQYISTIQCITVIGSLLIRYNLVYFGILVSFFPIKCQTRSYIICTRARSDKESLDWSVLSEQSQEPPADQLCYRSALRLYTNRSFVIVVKCVPEESTM